jgi:hypothetical protein
MTDKPDSTDPLPGTNPGTNTTGYPGKPPDPPQPASVFMFGTATLNSGDIVHSTFTCPPELWTREEVLAYGQVCFDAGAAYEGSGGEIIPPERTKEK